MTTIYVVTDLGQTASPMQRAFRFFRRCWRMIREWQQRHALRGAMYSLSDWELQDIGTTRGEIEHLARSPFLANVRFGAHNGLGSDIAPCPKSAKRKSLFTRRIAPHPCRRSCG
jgi:uncharacterized protein YjiS (DUF1127 family)